MEIFLIDGIGPFFRNYTKRRINWSKIPFESFPKDEADLANHFKQIEKDMHTFAAKAKETGYNSISLDDVAHLTTHEWLEPEVNRSIKMYQLHYRKIFSICTSYGLDIYLTMDILSLTPNLRKRINGSNKTAREYLSQLVEKTLTFFPEIKGLILRIGECDGKDVKGIFKSELILKTSKQVNTMLKELLPVFERFDRYLILRTWTVGAYPVGDLIWHRQTTARMLHGIESSYFILSMKYGESDFFRYLPLNKHFFRLKIKKIVELQARREYEGCGEYPSFVGWDYHEYATQLQAADNMVGISVWCQTGGWVPFRRLTYLEDRGIWNELNSSICIKIFKENLTVREAIYSYAKSISCDKPEMLYDFLRINDQVIKNLLYIQPFAEQKLFFRRVRIPPLLSVYWNNIFINHSVRKVLRSQVENGEKCVEQGYQALENLKEMKKMAKELQLPKDDIQYMYDTFSILALAREYYFLPYSDEIRGRLKKAKRKYKAKYPQAKRARYRIKTSYKPFSLKSSYLRRIFQIVIRKKRGYRIIDRLLTLHILSLVYKVVVRTRPNLIPKFAKKQAMGVDTLFK